MASLTSITHPSVASRSSCRVKPFELDAGILGRELPVDFGLKVVAATLPGGDLASHGLDAVDAPVQALADHDVDFDLGHVQPAAMLGRVDKLEAIPQRLGLLGGKRLIQRARRVRVQVVHDQRDALGVGIVRGDVLQEHSPVQFGSALRDLGQAPPGQRLAGHEHVAHPAALVFIVMALGPAGRRCNGLAGLANELAGRLIHAHHGALRIVGPAVDVEHLFHGGHEGCAGLRGNHPADFPPRLEFVFLSARRTVS